MRSWTLRAGEDLNFHLRRVAGATFYSGQYRPVEDQVLAPLADATGGPKAAEEDDTFLNLTERWRPFRTWVSVPVRSAS